MAAMGISKNAEKSHALDLQYHDAGHGEALIATDDATRRQKVQTVLLQGENDQLKDQVAHLESRVALLSVQYDAAQAEVDGAAQTCREQDSQLRAQAREYAALRAELLSLNNVTQDATKILAEKLALSRELAMMKPEVEHLRSQLTHQTDVLAEKLALERQLNTLEVELANEKRSAAQRATAQRQITGNRETAEEQDSNNLRLQAQIHELEKKLRESEKLRAAAAAATVSQKKKQHQQPDKDSQAEQKKLRDLEAALEEEKRESRRVKKALETELAEARGQIDVFEQRIGDLKTKLREVRDELREARADVGTAQSNGNSNGNRSTISNYKSAVDGTVKTKMTDGPGPKKAKASVGIQGKQRKRRAVDESSGPELMLQTPGNDNDGRTKRPLKKRVFDPALVNQKSTFSITPFLNKTAANPMDEATEAALADKSKAPEAERSALDKHSSSPAAGPAEIMQEASELIEDSIMGTRVSATEALTAVEETSAVSSVKKKPAAGTAAPKRRGRPPKESKVLGEAPVSKRNPKVLPAADTSDSAVEKTAVAADATADATAEVSADAPSEDQENQPLRSGQAGAVIKEKKTAAATVATTATKPTAVPTAAAATAEPKKKKRKMLGLGNKTIFDEEDDDGAVARGPVKTAAAATAVAATAGGGAAVKRSTKASLGGGAGGGGKRTTLGGVRNAFGGGGGGGFSPLKRDRRGVHASFLA